tara:strand:- start:9 stop:623 length:615 start_codon:yes stop_codon:yes gene_type:complete
MNIHSQPHYLAVILLILQREEGRLREFIPVLQRYDMKPEQLRELRMTCSATLSLLAYYPSLLDALDNLIEEHDENKVKKQSYQQLVRRLERYGPNSRSYIAERHGPYRQFLDQAGQVLPKYQEAFERKYETDGSLSDELQASMVRHLIDGYDLPKVKLSPGGEGMMLVYDTARSVESQVIDLELARRRRQQKLNRPGYSGDRFV